MPLSSPYLLRNLDLGKPKSLNFLDDFRPCIHDFKYRTRTKPCQCLSDIYFGHDCAMGKSFAERVKETRVNAKLTQEQLAKLAGISQITVSNIERGRNEGSRYLLQLAKALKVRPEWLVTGLGERVPGIDSEGIVAEFAWLYNNTTDEGRTFLCNAIKAARLAYIAGDRRQTDLPVSNDRRRN